MNRSQILHVIDPPDSGLDQLANAAIIAGYTFFSTLAGLGVTQAVKDPITALAAAGIAAGVAFFTSLITQRSLKKQQG